MGFKFYLQGNGVVGKVEMLHQLLRIWTLDILKQKFQIEIDNQRVAGPFKVIPFQNFQSTPLGLVPKYSGETNVDYRVIHMFLFLRALRSMIVFRRNSNQFNIRI